MGYGDAQWAKCLQHKNGDQSLDPPDPQKWWAGMVAASNPSTQEAERQRTPKQIGYLDEPQLARSGLLRDFVSIKWKVNEGDPYHQLWASLCTHVQPHIQTHGSHF